MINLLPPAYKKELRAARVNVTLRRYIIFQVIAVAVLAVIVTATFFLISMIKTNAEAEIASNEARAISYQKVEADAKQFQNNLVTAKAILDNEVRYTAVLLAISKNIPSGVVMSDLTLDAKTFGQPTSLSAQAKSYEDVLRLKKNFEESTIFTDVHLETVTREEDDAAPYPVTVQINVTIKKEITK